MSPFDFVVICVAIVAAVAWSASLYANRPDRWARLMDERRLFVSACFFAGAAIVAAAILGLVGVSAVWIEITGVVGVVLCGLCARLATAARANRRR